MCDAISVRAGTACWPAPSIGSSTSVACVMSTGIRGAPVHRCEGRLSVGVSTSNVRPAGSSSAPLRGARSTTGSRGAAASRIFYARLTPSPAATRPSKAATASSVSSVRAGWRRPSPCGTTWDSSTAFVMLRHIVHRDNHIFVVVENLFEELKRLVPNRAADPVGAACGGVRCKSDFSLLSDP
jgi:hypothetical protein